MITAPIKCANAGGGVFIANFHNIFASGDSNDSALEALRIKMKVAFGTDDIEKIAPESLLYNYVKITTEIKDQELCSIYLGLLKACEDRHMSIEDIHAGILIFGINEMVKSLMELEPDIGKS